MCSLQHQSFDSISNDHQNFLKEESMNYSSPASKMKWNSIELKIWESSHLLYPPSS